LAGRLIAALHSYFGLYKEARRRAFCLRAALQSEDDVELAIGLLPSWPREDANQGFPELLAVLPQLRIPSSEHAP
jgi:hypothetical protein